MRTEPSAPAFTELELTTAAVVSPVYSYRSAASHQITNLPANDKILVGAWDTGFCSCLNYFVPNALMSWCCPWVSLAQIMTRLGLYPFAKTLLLVLVLHLGVWAGIVLGLAQVRQQHHHQDNHNDMLGRMPGATLHSRWSAWFLLSAVCRVLYAVVVWHVRGRVRDRFQISGSRASDFVASTCCACCTVAQIATHVKSYTPGSCGFAPPCDLLPAYL